MRGFYDGQEEEDDDTPPEIALIEWLESWGDFSREGRNGRR